jgi:ATP-dependent Clp protease protease subunit
MAGAKGKRVSLPHSKIMIHQPSAGFHGQATDIEIHAKDILDTKKRLNELYVKHTGKDLKTVTDAMERDNFMTPQQALDFGLIDKITDKRP